MPEKRTKSAGGPPKKQRPTAQTTLKDHFRRANTDVVASVKEQDLHTESAEPVSPSPETANLGPVPAPPTKPPKPSKLFPIFAKFPSVREKPPGGINIDDTEIIDITDAPSDGELSVEHLGCELSTHPESSQAASRSPRRTSNGLDVHCSGDTRPPHAGMHLNTRFHRMSTKTPGSDGVAPLPSSCSQHVRGLQHSYTCSLALPKRGISTSCGPSCEGTLKFLATWRRSDDTPSSPLERIDRSLTHEQCEEYLQTFGRGPTELHPAFARVSLLRGKTPAPRAEMWTRRFRPRRANEVLGNERHALFLRDWLHALELHLQGCEPERAVQKGARGNKGEGNSKRLEPRGVKRPRVIRAVAKKRANKKRRVDSDDDMDDFVVPSDGGEEEADDPPEDSEDDFALCKRTYARLHRRGTDDTNEEATNGQGTKIEPTLLASDQFDFTDNLTNTLLITGPPGCGKTAAVYACAEELGFEVFEVYPGIGKRNGANLEHFVGDVGKNHIVQTVRRRKTIHPEAKERTEDTKLRDYLTRGKAGGLAGFGESQEGGSAGEPISVEDDNPTRGTQPLPEQAIDSIEEEEAMFGKCHAGSDRSRWDVRQSLVLLEEVDILFKEDVGFWPAVIEFIRCCQRPVVMTCNDPGLVPVADLPLQKVLVFEPCPGPVAATFLQCVSLTEGCLIPHEDLMVLYERREGSLEIPDVEYPRTERVVFPDLRRSITQLQMLCAGARHGSTSEKPRGEDASGHGRRSGRPISAAGRVAPTENRAESDWWVEMKRKSELMSHVDAEPSWRGKGTVEVGREEMGYVVLEGNELIAECVTGYARGEHEGCGTGPNEALISPAEGLERARVAYQTRMVEALADIALGPGGTMGVFLDYIPWVRHMVRVDDDLERRALEGRGVGGRCTRNSARTVHVRNIEIEEEGQRELWRRSGLY